MAKRRMFSVEVIEGDAFCVLPSSAQMLYVHLCMNADDDGFVDMWKGVLRRMSIRKGSIDDLIKYGYVIIFDDELLMISDWLVHNKIRLDRYGSGRYKDRLDTLQIQPNGRYIKASEDFFAHQDK